MHPTDDNMMSDNNTSFPALTSHTPPSRSDDVEIIDISAGTEDEPVGSHATTPLHVEVDAATEESKNDNDESSKPTSLSMAKSSSKELRSLLRYQILAFQHQNHSLRINVSELAACAGFHPYKSLPRLLQDHVYQGFAGQALLKHDAQLLGLKIVSDEQVWQELAQKAGKSTQLALKKALQVQTGETKVVSVEAAEELRRKVIQEAKSSKRLDTQQLATLEEGARYSIHTGFGTVWEDKALDLYEKQCGWEVSERNAEVRVWEFDVHGKELRPARPVGRHSKLSRNVEAPEIEASGVCKRQKLGEDGATDANSNPRSANDEDGESEDKHNNGKNIMNEKEESQSVRADERTSQPPFFCLRGSVDGIRDEMAPIARERSTSPRRGNMDEDEFADDDSWALRRVIVECKHRMWKIQPTPPIYEMIQATVYCLMYRTEEADLIQVLRRQKPRSSSAVVKQNEGKENESTNKVTNYFPVCPRRPTDQEKKFQGESEPSKQHAVHPESTTKNEMLPSSYPYGSNPESIVTENSEASPSEPAPQQSPGDSGPPRIGNADVDMEIAVTRISVDDPVFQHRHNVENIVLPRLHSWTKAVYTVRLDDSKRYQLLMALSTEDLRLAWNVLLEECPWLRHCDTSYNRDVASSSEG